MLRTTVPDEASDGKLSVTIEPETTTSVKTFKVLRPAAGEAKDGADTQGSETDGGAKTDTTKDEDTDASAKASKASGDDTQSSSGDARDDGT